MKKLTYMIIAAMAVMACGQSYEEEQRLSRAERARLAKEDSAAMKIGTLPTMDCLPLLVAKERHLFDAPDVDIRLKGFNSQIDCEAALKKGKLEGMVTDLVRSERLRQQGLVLHYATSTNASWQFVSNRKARIGQLRQLTDKMVAMARFSATDLLATMAVDSARLKREDVFFVQINDPNTRLHMLLNNEMDAMLLPEPQATTARLWKNPVLMDTQQKDIRLGVIVFHEKVLADGNRKKQYEAFLKGYNAAVDSINKYGVQAYAPVIKKYMKADEKTIGSLPKMRYERATPPRPKDVERAAKAF